MDILKHVADIIRERGFAVIHVHGDGNTYPFAYTVGLVAKGYKNLCLGGLDQETSAHLLNHAAKLMMSGASFDNYSKLNGWVVGYEGEIRDAAYAYASLNILKELDPGGEVSQLYFPDKNGLFPWDADCSKSISDCQKIDGMEPVHRPRLQ